ncbi:hypothetical protein [Psychrobacter sp. KH172YL61]|uniref:hypothetical protein n=1 Tax=Psychrobacter sp. KH172YL61 TaxID=2517899 RepID=UPI001F078759|nr:hypothetical protein [Psychrobacter sp. KH172YL61]
MTSAAPETSQAVSDNMQDDIKITSLSSASVQSIVFMLCWLPYSALMAWRLAGVSWNNDGAASLRLTLPSLR